MTSLVVGIFVLTYALIAARRSRWLPLGRPAGAMLGAVLMVAAGALTPEQSFRAIDGNTILLLFALMLLTVYVERAGFFDWAVRATVAHVASPMGLLAAVSLLAGGLSAFLMNDTVCVFLTPLVCALCARTGLPYAPFLMAVATSANVGSALTLVGNPQNMIIGTFSRMDFVPFLLRSLPAVAVGLALNTGLLWLFYRRRLQASASLAEHGFDAPIDRPRLLLLGLVLAGIATGFASGLHLGYTVLAGVCVLMVTTREDPRPVFARVDWGLLVFFSGLFVVVEGLVTTGLVARGWHAALPWMNLTSGPGVARLTAFLTAGSNVVSNVPMTLLTGPSLPALGHPAFGWVLLGYVTTVAGNLTLLGSVANLIVAERARDHYALGFWEYLRFGLPATLLVLAAGVPLVWWATT